MHNIAQVHVIKITIEPCLHNIILTKLLFSNGVSSDFSRGEFASLAITICELLELELKIMTVSMKG